MVLVTCSGMSLGRAIMVRGSMEGLCASHDLIRIEADASKLPLGYLYAFLRSRHGYVAMRRQIYGGNIKHIEPHHVGAVGVPRLGDVFEDRIGKEIDESIKLLDSYERKVVEALASVAAVTWSALLPWATPYAAVGSARRRHRVARSARIGDPARRLV